MSGDVWYLDTSAFVKLVRREPETTKLTRWLRGRTLVSSDLLRTEARRAVADEPMPVQRLTDDLIESLTIIRVTPELFDEAGRLPGRHLRSLDAIHLAAARALGPDLAGLVAYDSRIIDAADALGIATSSPA